MPILYKLDNNPLGGFTSEPINGPNGFFVAFQETAGLPVVVSAQPSGISRGIGIGITEVFYFDASGQFQQVINDFSYPFPDPINGSHFPFNPPQTGYYYAWIQEKGGFIAPANAQVIVSPEFAGTQLLYLHRVPPVASDFNGDSKSDILWQNTDGQAAIWTMNGTTPFNQPAVGSNPGPGWQVIGAGDFNGDGDADILWQNTNGQAAIWLMNGTTPTFEGLVGSNPGPSWHIQAAS